MTIESQWEMTHQESHPFQDYRRTEVLGEARKKLLLLVITSLKSLSFSGLDFLLRMKWSSS